MGSLKRCCLVVSCVVVTAIAAVAQIPIALPEDPTAIVISMDSHNSGIFGPTDIRVLTIRADGSITAGENSTRKLSSAELQDLLRLSLEDRGFFSLSAASIQDGIERAAQGRAGGIRVSISDASESTIRIRIAEKENAVTVYAPEFYAMMYPLNLYPETNSLDNFLQIQKTLKQIAEETRAGGKQVITDALTEANRILARDFPSVIPLKFDDFLRTELTTNVPSKVLHFYRLDDSCESIGARVQFGLDAKLQSQFTSVSSSSLLPVFCGPIPPVR